LLIPNRNAILKARQDRLKEGLQQGRQEGEKLKALEIACQLLDVLDLSDAEWAVLEPVSQAAFSTGRGLACDAG
jgi:flagellar biosynthesis/type III secretory pathway protein FliH